VEDYWYSVVGLLNFFCIESTRNIGFDGEKYVVHVKITSSSGDFTPLTLTVVSVLWSLLEPARLCIHELAALFFPLPAVFTVASAVRMNCVHVALCIAPTAL
jgi:hypothetical protein